MRARWKGVLIQFEHSMMSILNILLICHLLIGFRYQVKLLLLAFHQGELPTAQVTIYI